MIQTNKVLFKWHKLRIAWGERNTNEVSLKRKLKGQAQRARRARLVQPGTLAMYTLGVLLALTFLHSYISYTSHTCAIHFTYHIWSVLRLLHARCRFYVYMFISFLCFRSAHFCFNPIANRNNALSNRRTVSKTVHLSHKQSRRKLLSETQNYRYLISQLICCNCKRIFSAGDIRISQPIPHFTLCDEFLQETS